MSDELANVEVSDIDFGPEKIIVVDDEPGVRRFLERSLSAQGWQVIAVEGAQDVLNVLEGDAGYALVISDVRMPGRSGLWLLGQITGNHADTFVVMITGDVDVKTARESLTHGAEDYISKPVDVDDLVEVVKRALATRRMRMDNRTYREGLERLVQVRTSDLEETVEELREANAHVEQAYRESIYRLSAAAEYRDEATGNHIRRMGIYSYLIAREMGWDESFLRSILVASPMHDVGKIGVPDSILLKPAKLTAREFEEIKKHTTVGARILSGSSSILMQMAESIALTHHEKFDGSGYPQGLQGENIPAEGRIVAIADVFDALTSKRVYKAEHSVDKALLIMREEMKGSFDPAAEAALTAVLDEVLEAKERYRDSETGSASADETPDPFQVLESLQNFAIGIE